MIVSSRKTHSLRIRSYNIAKTMSTTKMSPLTNVLLFTNILKVVNNRYSSNMTTETSLVVQ